MSKKEIFWFFWQLFNFLSNFHQVEIFKDSKLIKTYNFKILLHQEALVIAFNDSLYHEITFVNFTKDTSKFRRWFLVKKMLDLKISDIQKLNRFKFGMVKTINNYLGLTISIIQNEF